MPFTVTFEENKMRFVNDDAFVDISLPNPVVEKAGQDKIFIHDNFGTWSRSFHFIDFMGGTIDGNTPTSIQEAYDELKSVQDQVNTANAGGGGSPSGLVELGAIEISSGTGAFPYSFPSGIYYSATVNVLAGSVNLMGSTAVFSAPCSFTYSCNSTETLGTFDLEDGAGVGTKVIIQVQSKP